mmetsp:Transcript_2338/g.9876  ORF Transcript_2338/g.9876 Transcript_2338/m.9876 type:complete len:147 (+) Transcript_2338:461-901(+)
MDTAGPIKLAEKHLNDGEPFFVLNSDVCADYPFKGMLEAHASRGAEATILITKVDDPSKFGVVRLTPFASGMYKSDLWRSLRCSVETRSMLEFTSSLQTCSTESNFAQPPSRERLSLQLLRKTSSFALNCQVGETITIARSSRPAL